MPRPVKTSAARLRGKILRLSLLSLLPTAGGLAMAQTPEPPATTAPASVPAGADVPVVPGPSAAATAQPDLSPKAVHEADDAYLRGARALDHHDLAAAEREFLHATQLNPRNRDYAVALAVTREHRLTELVQRAATAQKLGRTAEAETLLLQARELDPDNAVVRQHFRSDGSLVPFPAGANASENPLTAQRIADSRSLAPPVRLTPEPGVHSFHMRGGSQDILRAVCTAFGLKVEFDSSVTSGQTFRFDLDNADFGQATRLAETLTHTFAVPLQSTVAFFAKDSEENRAEFQPLVEETLFIPGVSAESLSEYANLARNVFDLRVVNAVGSSGGLVLRGDGETLERVNATFADLVDGGADVLLEVTLYEIDHSRTRTLGVSTPASIGVFPVAAEAESLISANQSLISAAIASGQLVLTGNAYTDALAELGLLLATGTISAAQFSSLLGVFGHYAGLPLAGVFLGSSTTMNALLNSSDVHILDTMQLRLGSGQEGSFRAGTRYPIETGLYSSNLSSSLAGAVSGLSINGTSVSSLLSQYLGSSSVSVPQIQFEDLGLTLKATPQVLRTGDVSLKLDFKVEALGSGTINTLPILNNRALVSQVTIPAGQTALLASIVTKSEQRSIDGLPFLSELPGFQGTEKSTEVDTTELLITLAPHVVRNRRMEVASRRLLLPAGTAQRQPQGGGGGYSPENPPPPSAPLPPAEPRQPETTAPPRSDTPDQPAPPQAPSVQPPQPQ